MSVRKALGGADKRRAAGEPAPSKDPQTVPLDELHTNPEAFQVRDEVDPDADRVAEIAEGIGGGTDDPLWVWWGGTGWIIIDGHHRHAAYLTRAERREIKADHAVPVRVCHAETAEGARAQASQVNRQIKRTLSATANVREAWRLVCYDVGSKREQVRKPGATTSTISRMRTVRKALMAAGHTPEGLVRLGWERAREMAEGKAERAAWTDEREEEEAQRWAGLIGKALTKERIVMNPSRLARAIEIIAPDLPSRLLEDWIETARDKGWTIPDEDGEGGSGEGATPAYTPTNTL